jgi:hypothetical protein
VSGWGCEFEIKGACRRLADRPCDPGQAGCVLHGRYRFTNPEKNRRCPESDPDPEPSIDARPGNGV